MRLLELTVLAALAATLTHSTTAAAKPRPADPCAALKGRDLAPGKAQRAVLRGSVLRFCVSGGTVRRLDGAPAVRQADGRLLLVHRSGTAEALDVSTGQLATLGPVAEIVRTRTVDYSGVVAVRRTAAGDSVVIAAPGRREVVVDPAASPITRWSVWRGFNWSRADGTSGWAKLPDRRLRCGDLRGEDLLDGPEIMVASPTYDKAYLGCAGEPDDPTFTLEREAGAPVYGSRAGTWLLRSTSSGGRYHSSTTVDLEDLATGRELSVAFFSGGIIGSSGTELREHVLLPDGRLVAILDTYEEGRRSSNVSVLRHGRKDVVLDTAWAAELRVEGDVVRWTVAGEERSAPLP